MRNRQVPAAFQSLLLPITLTLSLASQSLPSALAADKGGRDFYRAPSNIAGKTLILPIGTCFEGRIQSTIGSSASRSGERFTIEVSAPLLANGSEVLIPSGSEVIGEVAEAISSSAQPHDKGVKPLGILRVQLSTLKLPDGMTYPLVASFAPDGGARSRRSGGAMAARKSSVGYIGTQAGFDAVNPALQKSARSNRGKLEVLKRTEILNDPVLGDGGSNSNSSGQVRALIRKNRDLMILRGSSITIKLDAPLKIAFGASSAQTSMDSPTPDEPQTRSGKHFAKTRPAAGEGDNGQGADGQNGDDGGGQGQHQQSQQSQQAGGRQSGPLSTPVEQPGSSF